MATHLDRWIEQLQSEKQGERDEALEKLGGLGDPHAIAAVAKVLEEDANDNTRSFAARALGQIGHEDCLSPLLEALRREPKGFVRGVIVQALEVLASVRAVPDLVKVLEEGAELQLQHKAATALRSIGGEEAVAGFRKVLEAGPHSSLRAQIVTYLTDLKAVEAVGDIRALLADEREERVLRAAVSALARLDGEKAVPDLAGILRRHASPKIRVRAARELGVLRSPKAIGPLCSALLETREDTDLRAEVVGALGRFTDWQAKVDVLVSLLDGGSYRRPDLVTGDIVAALQPPTEVLSAQPHALSDRLIVRAVEKDGDRRMTENFAALITASAGGDPSVAGARLNAYEAREGASSQSLRALRIEIGGQTALDPVMQILSDTLEEDFRKPIRDLNEKTRSNWDRTIEYARYGFLARMVMSVLVFAAGLGLLIVSSWRWMTGDLGGTELFGTGVSFVSGLGAMLLIIYTGPLREIRDAVDDLGTGSAAFIGYIHRVLQISHTFSFLYLKQQVDFDQMTKSSVLIRDAMSETVAHLSKDRSEASDTVIARALDRLEAMAKREDTAAPKPPDSPSPPAIGPTAAAADPPAGDGEALKKSVIEA